MGRDRWDTALTTNTQDSGDNEHAKSVSTPKAEENERLDYDQLLLVVGQQAVFGEDIVEFIERVLVVPLSVDIDRRQP